LFANGGDASQQQARNSTINGALHGVSTPLLETQQGTKMNRSSSSSSSSSALRRHALATAVFLALAGGAAQAQLSTSTIKGQIAAAQAGTAVTAVNLANGNTYRTTTLADGSYVLTGLAPGAYEIRVGERKSEPVTVQVGETASVDLALPAAGAQQTITITGTAQRQGVKDSQVGTNVSRRLIENLPQSTRNFLSSADLAPGVAFSSDDRGNTTVQSGAQNYNGVNVYVDGVGQKNNILKGGLTGQDSSRGNPFPQSAIAEYKVITQNYKAEFDQVSSAAITAITKSGTNQFHGDAYVDRTGTNWRAKSVFEKEREASGVPLPPSEKYEAGFSLGGPIQQDALHFFVAYDGKKIDDSRQVVPKNLDRFSGNVGLVPTLRAKQGSTVDPFTEHLFFAKADAQISDDRNLSVSLRVRREADTLPENQDLSLPGNDKDRTNDETRLDVLHQWTIGPWQLDTRGGYEKFQWNPKSSATEPLLKYKVANKRPQLLTDSADVAFDGGSPDAQNRQQKGFTLSQDATYNGLAGHVIKGGVKLKSIEYDLSGTSRSVDAVQTLIDLDSGQPFYVGTRCTGSNVINNGDQSDQCRIERALAPATANFKNKQLGLFLQDDWAVTKQLELNLGLRYDYESNMLNNNYVTPADRVTALFAPDTRTFVGQTADPGQTYAQSIAKGGVDVSQYIADGRSRKPFRKAFAPRLGASFDLFGDKATVLFAGYGRSYDRTIANNALDELQKNQQTGGEIWLIRNDFKMPFADQFALGVRQAVGEWNTEATLSRIDAKNQFIWFSGNRDLNGGFFFESPLDPLSGGPSGFGSVLLGDFVGRTKTNALLLRAEKPFTSASGWSATFAYTYSDAQTTHREWNNDIFDFTHGKPGQGGFKPSTLVDKHRLVAAAVADGLLPWGLTLAGKVTLASGYPRRLTVCPGGFPAPNPDPALARVGTCDVVEGYSPSFRQVDVSVSKQVAFGEHKFSLRADVLNLFNTTNYDGFDDFVGAPPAAAGAPTNRLGGDNLNLDKPNSIRGDPRTFRLAVIYRF
jgi:outer membrane receptor protein involved in Fe transport